MAERFQPVGKPADTVVKFTVSDGGNRAIVCFKNNRSLLFGGCTKMPVEAVVGHVQFAVVKPAIKGLVRLIKRLGEGFVPKQVLSRQAGPKSLMISISLRTHGLVSRHTRYISLIDKSQWWGKDTVFLQHRRDGSTHR